MGAGVTLGSGSNDDGSSMPSVAADLMARLLLLPGGPRGFHARGSGHRAKEFLPSRE